MVESDTPESDKDLKQRRPVGSTSSNGLFVTSPIIRGTHRGDFDEPPNYTEYDDKTLWAHWWVELTSWPFFAQQSANFIQKNYHLHFCNSYLCD